RTALKYFFTDQMVDKKIQEDKPKGTNYEKLGYNQF
ncbi:unnamed protein product, partial [marine sediment metagenome]